MKFASSYMNYYFGEESDDTVNFAFTGEETTMLYNVFSKTNGTFNVIFSFNQNIRFQTAYEDKDGKKDHEPHVHSKELYK